MTALLLERASLPKQPIYTPAARWKAMSLRLGDWKLVVSGESKRELYNIRNDPSETTDLAAREPDRVRTMLAALKTARDSENDSVAKK